MEDLVVRPNLTIPADELELTAARSGGPGGQHVNKTSSKVLVRFDLVNSRALTDWQKARLGNKVPPRYRTKEGHLLVSSSLHRDQHRNREAALSKLAQVIREGLSRPKTRVQTKPTRGSKKRRRKKKEEHASKKRARSQKDW